MKSRRRDMLKSLLNGIVLTPAPLRSFGSDTDIASPGQSPYFELCQLIEAHKRACRILDDAYPQADPLHHRYKAGFERELTKLEAAERHFRLAFYSFPVTSLEEVETKASYASSLLEHSVDGTEIEELLILFRSFTASAVTSANSEKRS
jgi:hypothetical protein